VPAGGPLANLERSAHETLPLPPLKLRERVGATNFPDAPVLERLVRKASWWDPDPEESFLRQGRFLAHVIRGQLPAGTSLRGARVLDFGCGAGRVLRHLVEDVGTDGELHGVDIDRPSIEWLQSNASPPLHVGACGEEPSLPYPDDHFDLVYALSVFTHLAEHWAGWLLELRRILKPDGLLLATVIGRGTGADLRLSPPATDAAGMYVRVLGNAWDDGGPVAIHDVAWVAERWGRAFEIVSHGERVTGEPWPHDVVVARPRPGAPTQDELLATGADGEGDGEALAAQLRLLREDALARRAANELRAQEAMASIARSRVAIEGRAAGRLEELAARYAELERERTELESPRWALSRPARALARLRATASDGGAG
jgi:SAM-dependent methyltransferase